MAHTHANAMLDYAMDATETDKPWERWEFCSLGCDWIPLTTNPEWNKHHEYRRKPNQEQLDVEAFNGWWFHHGGQTKTNKLCLSDAWEAALKWERSKK